MRLLDRILGREVIVDGDLSQFGGFAYSAFTQPDQERIMPTWQNALAANASNSIVFGVMLARLSLFSEAEFRWQVRSDKSLFGNEDLEILEHPWPNGSTGELLARMEQDASMAGNAFVRRVNDGRLERLRPDWVTIMSGVRGEYPYETREVLGYLYEPHGDPDRRAAFFPVDEVAHWDPIPDPTANFRGMSWLTAVLREIAADSQMTEYKQAYLENAATPNLIVKYQQKVPQELRDGLAEQILARHGGVKNAFKALVLDAGADPMVVGSNFEQMAFDAVQAAGENRVAVAAGVPAIVAGLKEGLAAATFANYGMAMRRFADLTMRPNWRTACAALEKLLPVPAGCRLWFDTSQIAALQEGEKEQADTMAVLAAAQSSLIASGWEPESIKKALSAADITLLQHTGRVSVQLYEPGIAKEGDSAAKLIQQIYLGVGKVVTVSEARQILQASGVQIKSDVDLAQLHASLPPTYPAQGGDA